MLEAYKQFLDEMTYQERSIFFYHFILKICKSETARRLRLPVYYVRSQCEKLEKAKEILPVKQALIDFYKMNDKCDMV